MAGTSGERAHLHRRLPFLAVLLAAQRPGVVLAGPPEELVQLAMHPSASAMAVRYENGGAGAIVTDDGGKHWKLLCSSLVFDPATTRSGAIGLTSDGIMFVAGFPGMWSDDGHRCGWKTVSRFDSEYVEAFAVDPVDTTITYAVTGTGGKQNGLVRRDRNGTWSDLGAKDDVLIGDLLVVSRTGGRRFYAGATRGTITQADGGASLPNYVVRVSNDDGATWTEHVYGSAGPNEHWHLQAVDPSNPDRLIASVERAEDLPAPAITTDTVLVSIDQGATFKEYLTVTEIGGVAFASDGRLWIADAGALDAAQPRGIWSAPSVTAPPTKLPMANYPVQCLEYRESTSTLYACEHAAFGAVGIADGSFTTEFTLGDVGGFVQCPGVDMAAKCETQVCGAYCGLGHFPQAPVCCAYNLLTCGPLVSSSAVCPATGRSDAGIGDAGTTAGGSSSSGGSGNASGAGGSAGSDGAGGASTSNGNRDAGVHAGSHGGGSGCGCTVLNGERSGGRSAGAFALIGTVLLQLLRRRSCRRHVGASP